MNRKLFLVCWANGERGLYDCNLSGQFRVVSSNKLPDIDSFQNDFYICGCTCGRGSWHLHGDKYDSYLIKNDLDEQIWSPDPGSRKNGFLSKYLDTKLSVEEQIISLLEKVG